MVSKGDNFVFDAGAALKAATLAVIGLSSAWKYKLQESDRKEIIAEAVAKAWLHRETYDPARGPFQTWVGRIARNALLDHIRKARFREEAPARENGAAAEKSPDMLMMEDEGLEAVRRAVERLPESYREIIALLSEGKRPREIAGILGCSRNAATIRCCRARKALRELLEGDLQENGRQ